MRRSFEGWRLIGRAALVALLAAAAGCTGGDVAQESAGHTGQAPGGKDAGSDPTTAGGATELDAALDATGNAATEREAAVAAPSLPDGSQPLPDAAGPMPDADGVPDASGRDARVDAGSGAEVSTFRFDSREEWAPSGFQVTAGACYEIRAQIDDQWLDLDVPADLNGWLDDGDLRIALFAPLRRVVDDDIGFYQLACCVDRKLDQCFGIGEGATICPEIDGELFFFVNDVPGFEDNNVGTATLEIEPAG